MNCECGYPIPPLPRKIKEGLFTIKEVPNYENYICPICGREYKLKGYKGEVTILPLDKHYGGIGVKDNSNLMHIKPTNSPPPPPPPRQISRDNNQGYHILTKDDYKRYMLSHMNARLIPSSCKEHFDKRWQDISKGYNFIIGIGQEDELMFCSVPYFNEKVLE